MLHARSLECFIYVSYSKRLDIYLASTWGGGNVYGTSRSRDEAIFNLVNKIDKLLNEITVTIHDISVCILD